MTTVILYALCTSAIYYLGAQAQVTRFLWSRYPPALDALMSCAACSGVWYGAAASLIFRFPFLGLPGDSAKTHVVVALCSAVWTPVFSAIQIRCLRYLEAGE